MHNVWFNCVPIFVFLNGNVWKKTKFLTQWNLHINSPYYTIFVYVCIRNIYLWGHDLNKFESTLSEFFWPNGVWEGIYKILPNFQDNF